MSKKKIIFSYDNEYKDVRSFILDLDEKSISGYTHDSHNADSFIINDITKNGAPSDIVEEYKSKRQKCFSLFNKLSENASVFNDISESMLLHILKKDLGEETPLSLKNIKCIDFNKDNLKKFLGYQKVISDVVGFSSKMTMYCKWIKIEG